MTSSFFMNILNWNVRGLGMSSKRFLVKDFLHLHHADICCLQETKLHAIDPQTWRAISGPRLDQFSFIPADGSAGGILIGWDRSLFTGKEIFRGSFSLSIEFLNRSNNVSWVCTSVYGPCDRQRKPGFWNEIRRCCPRSGVPWVICGDFNSIFDPTDKLHGHINREDIRQAQNFVRDLQLLEPPSFGRKFTWTNEQSIPIWVKLDRFLVNPNWITFFPRVYQNYLPRFGSDHVPIRLESGIHFPLACFFRFEQAWCQVDNFGERINERWTFLTPSGCGAFILAKKISHLRAKLKNWAKTEFGSIKLKKLAILHDLDRLDSAREIGPPSEADLTTETQLRSELGETLKQEEIY
ncbi:DNase I-like protein [Dioscorea alata]|uniref:DNase I-like protein n=1 Tax=Dioscorea alata TaxID=55571 RepID=A0ACB7VSA0_DIOAL|nr:DNase I-like protein [Dioscorea alata]